MEVGEKLTDKRGFFNRLLGKKSPNGKKTSAPKKRAAVPEEE
jgi:hypothetical protein